jgi:hypothetical protein
MRATPPPPPQGLPAGVVLVDTSPTTKGFVMSDQVVKTPKEPGELPIPPRSYDRGDD